MKTIHLRVLTLISLTTLMAGCHRSPSYTLKNNENQPSAACSNNPYLMKYRCSIERIQDAADRGNPDAQYALGYMYYYGIDTVKDKDTAELWIKRSAEQGQPLAKKAWTLINTGANFDNLHNAAEEAATGKKPYVVVPQDPEDVDSMNVKNSTKSVTHELLGYQNVSMNQKIDEKGLTTGKADDRLHDARLADNATPVTERVKVAKAEKTAIAEEVAETDTTEKSITAQASAPAGSNGYTLQLLASADLGDIKNYTHAHHLAAGSHYYQTEYQGKPWYMLTYGHYDNAQAAHTALRELPNNLQHHQPWVKSMATIEKEVTLQKVVA